MLSFDFFLSVVILSQPLFLGLIIFFLNWSGSNTKYLFFFFKTIRRRFKSIKFFECAVYPRLINSIQYDLYIISFCTLFIIYDVDLIFFFTEVISFEQWSLFEAFFVFFNFCLLLFGLWYDNIRYGFNWNY